MKKNNCRLCGSNNLVQWLDLGFHPHSDQFRLTKDETQETYPLTVNQCQDCLFCQLGHVVSPKTLYTKDYLYESSITSTGDKHWEEFAEDVIKKTGIKNGLVLDIGSNDGTLLSKFQKRGFKVRGVDPCPDITKIANERGIPTVTDFFSRRAIEALPKVDLITGSNVFAHIDDLDDVIQNVLYLLKEDGVFVFESPYLGNFLSGLEYDTVYHQHLSYLSLNPLIKFFLFYGLEVVDVKMSEIHGGSFRVFVTRKGKRPIQPIVKEISDSENFTIDRLFEFGKLVEQHRLDLNHLINHIRLEGKSICAVSAPAKGMTLLNYTKIGHNLSFITEKSKLKLGRFTPGDHIKIVSDKELLERNPDYALLLAWNFSKEIIRNNPQFKGKWIVPLPKITII